MRAPGRWPRVHPHLSRPSSARCLPPQPRAARPHPPPRPKRTSCRMPPRRARARPAPRGRPSPVGGRGRRGSRGARRSVPSEARRPAACMVHAWYMHGIRMVHAWYMHGACTACLLWLYSRWASCSATQSVAPARAVAGGTSVCAACASAPGRAIMALSSTWSGSGMDSGLGLGSGSGSGFELNQG